MLTCAGELFVSRMAGSLLKSVGLPELITYSLEEYERKARELAHEPRLIDRFKQHLAQQPFDTTRFCRQLEKAYLVMHERATSGALPESFRVDPEQ